jgi:hypothetical protein
LFWLNEEVTEDDHTATMNASNKIAQMSPAKKFASHGGSPLYWRLTIDNLPINVMDPVMVQS